MSGSVDVPDHSHARFAVKGGAIGASIAFILGLVSKFILPKEMLGDAFDVFMYVWPWFMGFAFTGGGHPPPRLCSLKPFCFRYSSIS